MNAKLIPVVAEVLSGAQRDEGSGPIFLEKLLCSSEDTSLLECRTFTPLGLSTCDHSQDVGVKCTGTEWNA